MICVLANTWAQRVDLRFSTLTNVWMSPVSSSSIVARVSGLGTCGGLNGLMVGCLLLRGFLEILPLAFGRRDLRTAAAPVVVIAVFGAAAWYLEYDA